MEMSFGGVQMGLQKIHMSNDKKGPWLSSVCRGLKYYTQLCGDYFINRHKDPHQTTVAMESKHVFFRGSHDTNKSEFSSSGLYGIR